VFHIYPVADARISTTLHDFEALRLWGDYIDGQVVVQFAVGVCPDKILVENRSDVYGAAHKCRGGSSRGLLTRRVSKYRDRGFVIEWGDPSVDVLCPYCGTRSGGIASGVDSLGDGIGCLEVDGGAGLDTFSLLSI
jgi:hypothetical protein